MHMALYDQNLKITSPKTERKYCT